MTVPSSERAARRARRPLAVCLLAILITGCADPATTLVEPAEETPEAPDPQPMAGDTAPVGLVISEAHSASSAASNVGSAVASGAAPAIYVSAEPGTFPDAVRLHVRNLTTGSPAKPVALQDGGFDPIGIAGNPGDRIEIIITDATGAFRSAYRDVPVRKHPVIIRTNPPKGRTDVAFTVRPVVIFSEPIDAESVTEESVMLLRDGEPVSGDAGIAPDASFKVEFAPDAALEPQTTYELVIGASLRDLNGDLLAEETRVPFSTGQAANEGVSALRISNVTAGGDFDIDGYDVRLSIGGRLQGTETLELNTFVDFTGLPAGEAVVEVLDVASNCALTGGATHSVTIEPFRQAELQLAAECKPRPELAGIRLVMSKWARHAYPEVFHLWSVAADGSELRQLTSGTVSDLGARVSPDGARIAFSRDPEGWGIWGTFKAYVMDTSGGAPVQVIDTPPLHSTIAWSWSPDGRQIAMQYGTGGRIDIINVDGSGRLTLLNDGTPSSPAWSPDGGTIAFLRQVETQQGPGECGEPNRRQEIWTVPAEGGVPRFVRRLETCWQGSHLSWSSDGRILFSDARVGVSDEQPGEAPSLWAMQADGTGAVRLVEPTQFGLEFGAVSPDGRLITMTRTLPTQDYRVDVYLLDTATGALTRVTADGVSIGATFLH